MHNAAQSRPSLFPALVTFSALLAGAAWSSSGQSVAQAPNAPRFSADTSDAARLAWGDVDGDQRADALAVRPDGGLRLFQNAGGGQLVEITELSGLANITGARFAMLDDFDGDGLADIVLGGASGLQFLVSTGVGFLDVTATSGLTGLTGLMALHSARSLDYDEDGRLDLLVTGGGESTLFHGLGTGAFERVELNLAQDLPTLMDTGLPTNDFRSPGDRDGRHPAEGSEHPGRAWRGPVDLSLLGLGGGTQSLVVSTPPFGPASPVPLDCLPSIQDQAGGCLGASSFPTLGMLYPLGNDLNVDSAGNIGMGTTKPVSRLHLADTGAVSLQIEADTDNVGEMDNVSIRMVQDGGGTVGGLSYDNLNVLSIAAETGKQTQMAFRVAGEERLRITNDGRLGIGTSTPDALLDVMGSAKVDLLRVGGAIASEPGPGARPLTIKGNTADKIYMSFQDNDSGVNEWEVRGGDDGSLHFWEAFSERVRFAPGGRVGIGTTSPEGGLTVTSVKTTFDPAQQGVHMGREPAPFSNSTVMEIVAGVGGSSAIDFSVVGHVSLGFGARLRYDRGSDRLVLDAADFHGGGDLFVNGRVGIGTTSPEGGLTVTSVKTNFDPAQQGVHMGREAAPYSNSTAMEIVAGVGGSSIIDFSVVGDAEADFGARLLYDTGSDQLVLEAADLHGQGDLFVDGRVGIGTSTPQSALTAAGGLNPFPTQEGVHLGRTSIHTGVEIVAAAGGLPFVDFHTGTDQGDFGARLRYDTGSDQLVLEAADLHGQGDLFVDGRVGIGTSTPQSALTAAGGLNPFPTQEGVHLGRTSNHTGVEIVAAAGGQPFVDFHTGTAQGDFGARLIYHAGVDELRVDGAANFNVNKLKIRGGADIVEGFETSDKRVLEPGTVVVIDPDSAGALMQSVDAYDFKVAGVVSGANGVAPGIHLGQDGVLDGATQVAMAGRVYVKSSAENGAIRPGDRLTTASLAGHAMKATDAERCDGTVLGKAMSSLDEGTGLVLVLVNLQ